MRVHAGAVTFSDPSVQFIPVAGTDEREAALVVQTEDGTTLVESDLMVNLPIAKDYVVGCSRRSV